ncbi:hypothetical protein ACTWQB_14405 [Piscibacillus sp. B03]|uniref:hypothetical protein n=1 Tax=Piscibacillus sp. B03 TaxID=3457430 RepID=UPI003FCEB462
MMNPFESNFFNSTFSLGDKRFNDKELVLSLLLHNDSVMLQYLIFNLNDTEEVIIIGFDFEREQIIPVEKAKINVILQEVLKFISSEYNTVNFSMDIGTEVFEYFSKAKIKKSDFYSYKNITVLASNQRNVIPCNCEVYNNQITYKPVNSVILMNRNGFLYGKVKLETYQKNINEVKRLHLIDDLIIRYNLNEESIDTVGRIYEAESLNSNTYMLTLSSFMHELVHTNVGYHYSYGLNIQSHVNAILRTTGIEKKQINIEGFEETNSPYLVIIPIENLSITNESFGLGDINFYNKGEIFNRYKSINEFYNQDLHGHFDTFAQTIVESDNTFDAYQAALQKIQSAIDIIMLFSKNDRVHNFYNLGQEFNKWNRLKIYQNPSCSTYYYVENIIGTEKIFSDSKNKRKSNSLVIDSTFDTLVKELEWFEEKLYKKLIDQQSPVDTQLFNALKWLNRSWKASDIEDKIIYTNISMEFLVDKVKTDPFIPKEIVTEFKRELKQLLKDNELYDEDNANKIKQKSLGLLSSPPIKIKIQSLIKQLGVPITEEEFNKFWEVRSYRNDLVHGRGAFEINSENVILSNIILGELISCRLQSEDGV